MLNRRIVASIIVVLALFFLYWECFQWLYSQWMNDKAYSHGFFIPVVSLYLVWINKEPLLSTPSKPSKIIGSLSVFICLLLLLIGRGGAVVQIEALSFFLVIPSIIFLLYGWQHLKMLFFPILYLQFMIPWMDPILERMHRPFQLISATIGTALLELGYPVSSNGVNINLPDMTMVVAQECSGIVFLVSVIAVGLPLVYLCQKNWYRAASIIVIGCVLTVLSNGLRVAVAGYFGQTFGPEMLHGPAHIFQGWSVAWMGWIGLFLVNWLFMKIPYKKGEPKYHLYQRWRLNKNNPHSLSENIQYGRFHFSGLLLLLFGFAFYLNFYALPNAVALKVPLEQFPTEVADWQSMQSGWQRGDTFFQNLDDELSRMYRDKTGNEVYLFVGYYQKQDNDKRLISYLSRPLYNNAETITISQDNSSFKVILSSLQKDLSHLNTLFWYQLPDKLKMTDRLKVKLHVLLSGILKKQNNGAIILLATPKSPGEVGDKKGYHCYAIFCRRYCTCNRQISAIKLTLKRIW